MSPSAGRRKGNSPWKRIYGVDRKYTRRVDGAKERAAAHVCGPTCKKNREDPR